MTAVGGVSDWTQLGTLELAHVGNIASCQEDLSNGLHEMSEQAVP